VSSFIKEYDDDDYVYVIPIHQLAGCYLQR